MNNLTVNERINLKSHISLRDLHYDGLVRTYNRATELKNSGIDYEGNAQWDAPFQLSDLCSMASFEKRYIHD